MSELSGPGGLDNIDEGLKLFIDSVVDYAIIGLDAGGNIASWNEGARRLKQYDESEILGKHFSTFYSPADREAGLPGHLMQRAIDEGHVEHTGWRVRKDGTKFWGDVVLTAVRNRSGKLVGFTKVTRDLTERKLAEEREHALTIDLERANRLKSEFLANMSHEIRTPLNGILGMLGLLLDTDLSERQRDFADTAAASSNALLRIVNDILDFSKVEAGKLEIENVEFDLAQLVDELGDLFRPGARGQNLDLSMNVDMDVPQYVCGDSGRLRQILTNLLGNALKFTQEGSVTLHVSLAARNGDEALVRFDVTDTGIGINAEKLDTLFAPFAQGDLSTTRQYGGTGLGLTICRQLSGLMGGALSVESEEGQGSTFTITLPLDVAATHSGETGTLGAQPAAIGHAQNRGRLLVVDDNVVNQKVTALLVEKLGYRTVVVNNGQEAVDHVSSDEFDGVLMDIQMPVMDGYEATQTIREMTGRRSELPIIAVTAAALPQERDRCLEAGMTDYISKPVDMQRLAELLQTHIAGHVDDSEVVIERVVTLKETLGDHFQVLLDAFITSSRQRLDEIDAALRTGDVAAAEAAAHTLKGSSLTLSANAVAEACGELETVLQRKDVDAARAQYPSLVEVVSRAEIMLRSAFNVAGSKAERP